MAKLNGTDGVVNVGGQEVEVTSWALETAEESLPTTHSGSGGYKASIGGVKSAEGTFDADWDAAASPHAAAPNLTVGTVPDYLRLYVNTTKYYNFPSLRITKMSVKCEIAGKITYTCSWEATGTWTEPA